MSSVAIISTLIALLAALVCYAFIYQTLATRREQRARLMAALKAKSRTFKYMFNGFPNGFLPRELLLLVLRSLIDVSEQLAKLEPSNTNHQQDLQHFSGKLLESQRQARPDKQIQMQNPQQISEVRACLEELFRHISRMEAHALIQSNQAATYRNQIRQLVLQLTVDNYCLSGRAAQVNSKPKLALHYYDLSLNLLLREGHGSVNQNRIEELRELIQEVRHDIEQHDPDAAQTPEQEALNEEIASEWAKFDTDNSQGLWKKKNVYD